jgi:Flp pilus assembly protein TadG
MRRLAPIWRDRRGFATTELALLTACFFFAFMAVLDFGSFFVSEHRLGQAVAAAGTGAFANRTSVDYSAIEVYVRNASGQSGATVSVTCNGVASPACTNSSRTCACVSSSGTYTGATCGQACSGTGYSANQTAGYYLTINASNPYSAVILPTSIMKNSTIRRTVTVRLQ